MTPLMTWLVPAAGPERDQLAATIDRLAAEHDAPRFQPHVTMLATLDCPEDLAARTLTSLAAGTPPIELTLVAIGYEQTYFRSLYLRAEPSAQLLALREAGQRAWALDPSPYMPHLSLLYSDIPDKDKHSLIERTEIRLPLTVRLDAVELWARNPAGVRSWYRIARVPLSG
jgi:2'-5' RNA ligase